MNVVITGCGSIGARHARNVMALGRSVYLSDIDPSRATALAAELGCGVVTPSADWWPHAVLICTPASSHAAVAKEILNSDYRIAMFVEKPLALSVEECAIFKEWPHPTTMVGYNWLWNTEVERLRALVAGPCSAHLQCDARMETWPGSSYADPLLECSHEIALVHAWSNGEAVLEGASIFPTGAHFIWPGFDVSITWSGAGNEQRSFELWDPNAADGNWTLKPSRRSIDASYLIELAHFLNCAERRIPTDTPFADGIRVLDVIAQAKAMAACVP